MGIFGALSTSVTGLKAQSYAIENISGNIANSQTTGFKRVDTSFVDLIPDAPASRQPSGSVLAYSRGTNTVQGDLKDSDIPTHMAINGEGFFVVDDAVGQVDNRPIFSGIDKFSRRGDFQLDRYGHLKNGAGFFLKGLSVDPNTGNVNGTVPEIVRITSDFQPARQSSVVNYRANLPSFPRVPRVDSSAPPPNGEILSRGDFPGAGNNPVSTTLGGDGNVMGQHVEAFVGQSIDGGGMTMFDANGTQVKVQFRWAKVEKPGFPVPPPTTPPAPPATPPTNDTWNLFYQTDSNAGVGQVAWQNMNVDYSFGTNGQLVAGSTLAYQRAITVDGLNVGNVNFQHGSGGLTQFADVTGNINLTEFEQNGYAAGRLASITLDDSGAIVGTYTNSRTQKLAQIPVAVFRSPDSLVRRDGGTFMQTSESGAPIFNIGTAIQGGALESSNTDIADEFTKLIVTQQAYTANTRVVTTGNEMLREALNMLR
jgi:flagellar hook protein FlgE